MMHHCRREQTSKKIYHLDPPHTTIKEVCARFKPETDNRGSRLIVRSWEFKFVAAQEKQEVNVYKIGAESKHRILLQQFYPIREYITIPNFNISIRGV